MTKKEMFVAIKAVVADNQEMVDFIDHEIELLSRSVPTIPRPRPSLTLVRKRCSLLSLRWTPL